MSRRTSSTGGMQTSALSNSYCPICHKEMDWVSYPQLGYYSHMSRGGLILLCDANNNLKRKRIKSEEWHRIQTQYETQLI
jgi:hypothetical protein